MTNLQTLQTSNAQAFLMSQAVRERVTWIYNQTADSIEEPPLALWERYGQRTVDRLGLVPGGGARVLDIGCGAGAAALHAAGIAGPAGRVLGVDLAENLLAVARRRAGARGIGNARFECADMTGLDFPDESFDAVISVFSIFFVRNMEALVGALWRMVKPGGTLAITTWGPTALEPLDSLLREAAAPELPGPVRGSTPMDRVLHPHLLIDVMRGGGAANIDVFAEQEHHELAAPTDWWTVALGSSLRAIIASLAPAARDAVRRRFLGLVRHHGATSITADVIYGIARKPAPPGDMQ